MAASLISRLILIFSGVCLLATVAYKSVTTQKDPYRCGAALNTGRWIDPVDENGDRQTFRTWQPDGCSIHQYTSEDIRHCMQGRHFLFSGDSTTRQVAYGMARLVSIVAAHQYFHDIQHSLLRTIYLLDFTPASMST